MQRLLIIFVLSCLSIFALGTADTMANAADSTPPEILSIQIDKAVIVPGEKVTVSVKVKDDSMLEWVYVKIKPKYRSISSTSIQLKYDAASETYIGTYTIPAAAFNEQWYVSYINARDIHGNVSYLADNELSLNNWSSTVSFTIFDGNDIVPPTFQKKGTLKLNVTGPFNFTQNLVIYDDVDSNVSTSVKVKHDIPSNIPGTYMVHYEASDTAGNIARFSQEVILTDLEAPKFQNIRNRTVYAGDKVNLLEGIKAIDNVDGDITSSIRILSFVDTSKPGEYPITYRVSDKAGNTISSFAVITVAAKSKVTIEGADDKLVLIGSSFDPLEGIKATDELNNDLTGDLNVTSTVNLTQAGLYSVSYSYEKEGYETKTVYRQVTVAPYSTPRITGLKDMYLFEGETIKPPRTAKAYNIMGMEIDEISTSIDREITSPGNYWVTYSVMDHFGFSYAETRNLKVLAKMNSFIDVPVAHPYFKEIQIMKEMGIINGYPDQTFKPGASISRKHVASLNYRSGISLEPIREKTVFTDVPESHTYYTEIMALYQAGIVDGTNGKFNPENPLTRAQLAKILVNAFHLERDPSHLLSFTDTNSHWASDYINILSSNQITTGSMGKFNPNQQVSRMHYATFMYRIVQ